MPLVKIFARPNLPKSIPLHSIQQKLCAIWSTKPATTKLIRFDAADWTGEQFHEDVYVDIRAKATPDRTREAVLEHMTSVQKAFADHGLLANVRLETYVGDAYFHLPPEVVPGSGDWHEVKEEVNRLWSEKPYPIRKG